MRPYQHLTTKASTESHPITCISLDISVLIVRFGERARACRVNTHTRSETNSPPFNNWLFDELSDNNASDNGSSLSASAAVNKQI